MPLSAPPQLGRLGLLQIVIVKEDKLYGECLKQIIENTLQNAKVTQVTSLVEAGSLGLDAGWCDLLICGIGFSDGDSLEWLERVVSSRSANRILILTTCREILTLAALREMQINGMFDPINAGLNELSNALDFVISGGYYLSPSFHDLLHPTDSLAVDLTRNLTPKEQLVMTAIGDGSDDAEAAGLLDMSTAAVRSHRKRLHSKLGISHRGQLVRTAFVHGFVRVANNTIVRPGFANLMRRVSRPLREATASQVESLQARNP